ncbi:hypothetical protein FJZ53_05860 [Candidatus Woesearchaeota archaeon]|nr:hypothetical protein [Candidatus Woesearchaeota archaeon]
MRHHIKRIRKHLSEKKHHYKLGLLGVVLLAIFLFAHKAGKIDDALGSPCSSNKECLPVEFCEFSSCSSSNGKCVVIPEICPVLWQPVCGCNGKLYPNDCTRMVSKTAKNKNGLC